MLIITATDVLIRSQLLSKLFTVAEVGFLSVSLPVCLFAGVSARGWSEGDSALCSVNRSWTKQNQLVPKCFREATKNIFLLAGPLSGGGGVKGMPQRKNFL